MTVTELGKPATGDHEAEEARLRRELAAVYRLIAHFKMTDLIYNHISVRLPGPEHRFLLNPYGLLYEEITATAPGHPLPRQRRYHPLQPIRGAALRRDGCTAEPCGQHPS